MNYQELLIRAMTYKNPETIPARASLLPALWKKYPDEIRAIVSGYPQFFGDLGKKYDYDTFTPETYHEGSHIDEWGCVWSNIQEGMESIVTGHPIKTREEINAVKIPDSRTGRMYHGFMYLRYLDLRGFEQAMLDFAEEPPELQILIDKILQFNLIQTEIAISKNPGPIQSFGDDLGMQKGIAIGPQKWVKYMKPCFAAIFKKCHDAGKLVYMHTDGCIWEIMPDLKEAGADMINPQYRANGLENLVKTCRGKIPISLDFDRQFMPFATAASITEHIRECVEALYMPEGGLALSLELGMDVNPDIAEAALAALEKYRHYNGRTM